MKITIELPKEFEEHFRRDRFEDSLKRLKGDAGTFCLAGRYEMELCDMLTAAFKNAEEDELKEKLLREVLPILRAAIFVNYVQTKAADELYEKIKKAVRE